MRVLYFHQHFSTPQGSAGHRSYEMARCLVADGHQVTMICGRYKGAVTGLTSSFERGRRKGVVDGIEIIEFDLAYSNYDSLVKRSLIFLKFVLSSIGLVFTQRYDVLFATSTPLTIAIPGIVARWIRRKPFVFEVRDLWPELPKAMGVVTNPIILTAMSLLEKVSYKSANAIIGLSPGMVDGIMRHGVSSTRVNLVSNGCDLDFFQCNEPMIRPQGISDSDLMVIYTGTHGVANGLDSVLDAASELIRRGRKDIKIVLVGDGKLKPALQERALREQLNIVIFLETLPKPKLVALMANADVGLQILANIPAFYYGTSPNKFFDYIAAGLPVLNNYPGWLAEKITEYNCGLSVPPSDPIAFADALEHLAANKSQLPEQGRQARRLAELEFDRRMLAKQWVNVLENAVSIAK